MLYAWVKRIKVPYQAAITTDNNSNKTQSDFAKQDVERLAVVEKSLKRLETLKGITRTAEQQKEFDELNSANLQEEFNKLKDKKEEFIKKLQLQAEHLKNLEKGNHKKAPGYKLFGDLYSRLFNKFKKSKELAFTETITTKPIATFEPDKPGTVLFASPSVDRTLNLTLQNKTSDKSTSNLVYKVSSRFDNAVYDPRSNGTKKLATEAQAHVEMRLETSDPQIAKQLEKDLLKDGWEPLAVYRRDYPVPFIQQSLLVDDRTVRLLEFEDLGVKNFSACLDEKGGVNETSYETQLRKLAETIVTKQDNVAKFARKREERIKDLIEWMKIQVFSKERPDSTGAATVIGGRLGKLDIPFTSKRGNISFERVKFDPAKNTICFYQSRDTVISRQDQPEESVETLANPSYLSNAQEHIIVHPTYDNAGKIVGTQVSHEYELFNNACKKGIDPQKIFPKAQGNIWHTEPVNLKSTLDEVTKMFSFFGVGIQTSSPFSSTPNPTPLDVTPNPVDLCKHLMGIELNGMFKWLKSSQEKLFKQSLFIEVVSGKESREKYLNLIENIRQRLNTLQNSINTISTVLGYDHTPENDLLLTKKAQIIQFELNGLYKEYEATTALLDKSGKTLEEDKVLGYAKKQAFDKCSSDFVLMLETQKVRNVVAAAYKSLDSQNPTSKEEKTALVADKQTIHDLAVSVGDATIADKTWNSQTKKPDWSKAENFSEVFTALKVFDIRKTLTKEILSEYYKNNYKNLKASSRNELNSWVLNEAKLFKQPRNSVQNETDRFDVLQHVADTVWENANPDKDRANVTKDRAKDGTNFKDATNFDEVFLAFKVKAHKQQLDIENNIRPYYMAQYTNLHSSDKRKLHDWCDYQFSTKEKNAPLTPEQKKLRKLPFEVKQPWDIKKALLWVGGIFTLGLIPLIHRLTRTPYFPSPMENALSNLDEGIIDLRRLPKAEAQTSKILQDTKEKQTNHTSLGPQVIPTSSFASITGELTETKAESQKLPIPTEGRGNKNKLEARKADSTAVPHEVRKLPRAVTPEPSTPEGSPRVNKGEQLEPVVDGFRPH